MRWIKGLIPAFIILFFVVCVCCLVWVSVWGLPESAKRWLEGELREQGVEVDVGELRISFIGGVYLAANDVVLYNKLVDHQEPSEIKKLRLDLDIGALWRGKFLPERVEIVDGRMSLPTGSPGGSESRLVTLNGVNAVLVLDDGDSIEIRDATGVLQGMNVHVEGSVSTGDEGETPTLTKADIDRIVKQIDQIAAYIDMVKWRKDAPPHWNIRVAETGGSMKASVEMETPELTYRELTVRDVIFEAEYSGNVVRIKRASCREAEGRGKLNASSTIDLSRRVVQARFRSDVPIFQWGGKIGLVDWFPKSVRVIDTPSMRGDVTLSFSEDWQGVSGVKAKGNASIGRFEVGESNFDRFSTEFSYDNGNFYVTDFNLVAGEQLLKGQVLRAGERVNFEVRSTFGVDEVMRVAREFTKEDLALPEGYEVRGRPDFLAAGDLMFKNGWDRMPEVNSGRLVLKADDLSVKKVAIGSVIVDADIEEKKLTVRQCSIRNEDRKLDLKGKSVGEKVYFSCESNLKPSLLNQLINDFVQLPGQLELPEDIDFDANGIIDIASSPRVDGVVVQLKGGAWKWNEVQFDGIDASADLRGGWLFAGNCAVSREGREFNVFSFGNIEGGMMALGRTALKPETFEKLLKFEDDDFFFERFKYPEKSLFDVGFIAAIDVNSPAESFKATALANASDTYYRDVLVSEGHALFQIDLNRVIITNASLKLDNNPYLASKKMGGGTSHGSVGASRVVLDLNENTATVEGVQSTSYPDYAFKMFSKSASKVLSDFGYSGQVNISGGGVFPMGDDFSAMKGTFTFVSRGGRVDYKLLGTTLQMANAAGTVTVTPSWVKVSDLRGNIWGGVFNGKIDAQIDHGNEINGMIATQGLNLAEIGKSYETKMEPGAVEASVSFRSHNGNVSTMTGTGRIQIRNGNLVDFPLFGTLGKVIADIVPGLGQLINYNITSLNCEYELGGGFAKSTYFKADGTNMSLEGGGKVNMETTRVDAGLRLRFKGITGLLSLPFRFVANRLFNVKGQGPIDNVEWMLDPLSTEGE